EPGFSFPAQFHPAQAPHLAPAAAAGPAPRPASVLGWVSTPSAGGHASHATLAGLMQQPAVAPHAPSLPGHLSGAGRNVAPAAGQTPPSARATQPLSAVLQQRLQGSSSPSTVSTSNARLSSPHASVPSAAGLSPLHGSMSHAATGSSTGLNPLQG